LSLSKQRTDEEGDFGLVANFSATSSHSRVSNHYGLLMGRFWHGPAVRQSPALPRLSLRFRLVQLAPSGGLCPTLTNASTGRADFSP
jgi:hypothetical protein